MRWILVGVLVVTAGCAAILAREPRADEGLEPFYGETAPEADAKMEEMQAEERTASGLDATYDRLERKYPGD
jgi:hypothetical protein